MGVAESVPILVTDHATWQAAIRFPWFDTATIEQEVRSALVSGRVSRERAHLGLYHWPDKASLYVWVELADGVRRVYALRMDAVTERQFVVTTTMRGVC